MYPIGGHGDFMEASLLGTGLGRDWRESMRVDIIKINWIYAGDFK